MMRKSTVALIIIISGLMFYAGCDDNDGGGGQGAPGADISRICERCPCNFFMDIDVSCWGNPKDVGALFDPGKGGLNTDCALVGASVQLPELDVKTASGESTCNIKLGHPTDLCPSYTDPQPLSSASELDACRVCLWQYGTFLQEFGFDFGDQPPVMCNQ